MFRSKRKIDKDQRPDISSLTRINLTLVGPSVVQSEALPERTMNVRCQIRTIGNDDIHNNHIITM